MGSVAPILPTPAVSLTEHPATLPEADIAEDLDVREIVGHVLARLLELTEGQLASNAIWRDSLAFTGTFRTFFSPETVVKHWRVLAAEQRPCKLFAVPDSGRVARFGPKTSWVESDFIFETQGALPARCSGKIGLVPQDGRWKIWLLCTVLEQPHGFPDVDHLVPGPDAPLVSQCYDCIVIGAGIGGLCMAGRLKALRMSYLVIDKHESVGDVWVKDRYDSVKLHTSRCYNQLPGLPKTFRPEDPYLLSGQDLKQGFQRYVDTFGINIMTSTSASSAKYDERSRTWSVAVRRKGQAEELRTKHLVLATGNKGSSPVMPTYEHSERFAGDVIHAGHWRNGGHWKGKRGIVIGSANSAHDIISDMVKADFTSVTVVQRSKTFVLPLSTFSTIVDPVFNDQTPTEVSDRILLSYPLPLQRLIAMKGIRACAEQNPDCFGRLEAQGFKTERFGDLWGMMYDREGGHFFDVGAGELIRNGKVKVKSDALPTGYTETGLEFSDGSRIDTDVVVFATGYEGSIKQTARAMLGNDVAASLEEFWQCSAEGEVRGAWKHVGHDALWYTGHGYAHARYYSRFVAMHIKADIEGKPMQPYTAT